MHGVFTHVWRLFRKQRFSVGGLECDMWMLAILVTGPSLLLMLTCIAGSGADHLDDNKILAEIRARRKRRAAEGDD